MRFIYLFAFMVFNLFAFAQNVPDEGKRGDTAVSNGLLKKIFKKKTDIPEKGKLYFVIVPAIASSPSTGFLYGIASTAGIYLADPNTTQVSSGVMAFTNTTKHQLLFALKTNIFLKENSWIFNGDIRIFRTSQPTYGLGTGPQSRKLATNGIEYGENLFSESIDTAQMLHFKWMRFHETALKEVRENLYLGVGYHLDLYRNIDDKLLGLDTTNGNVPTITSHWVYNTHYGFSTTNTNLSGFSLNFLWDSRDNTVTPYAGKYALVTYRYYPTFLGSDQNASQLWIEYREFFSLSKKSPENLLAFWAYGSFSTSGQVSYLNLPASSYDVYSRSSRAYTQGRFRGDQLLYSEVEYRFLLPFFSSRPKLLGGVIFANAVTASSVLNDIPLFNYVEPGVGVGIRILINRKTRSHLTIDYAWGNYGAHGFYFNINEAF